MVTVRTCLAALVGDEDGQDLIEYGLLAGLISLVAILAITNAGTEVAGMYASIAAKLQAAPVP